MLFPPKKVDPAGKVLGRGGEKKIRWRDSDNFNCPAVDKIFFTYEGSYRRHRHISWGFLN